MPRKSNRKSNHKSNRKSNHKSNRKSNHKSNRKSNHRSSRRSNHRSSRRSNHRSSRRSNRNRRFRALIDEETERQNQMDAFNPNFRKKDLEGEAQKIKRFDEKKHIQLFGTNNFENYYRPLSNKQFEAEFRREATQIVDKLEIHFKKEDWNVFFNGFNNKKRLYHRSEEDAVVNPWNFLINEFINRGYDVFCLSEYFMGYDKFREGNAFENVTYCYHDEYRDTKNIAHALIHSSFERKFVKDKISFEKKLEKDASLFNLSGWHKQSNSTYNLYIKPLYNKPDPPKHSAPTSDLPDFESFTDDGLVVNPG
jgi:hypothetical protein